MRRQASRKTERKTGRKSSSQEGRKVSRLDQKEVRQAEALPQTDTEVPLAPFCQQKLEGQRSDPLSD